MKIVNISTEDFAGGAGRACYRLHKAFQRLDIDSRLIALHKTINDESVISAATGGISRIYSKFAHGLDNLWLSSYDRQRAAWSPAVWGVDISTMDVVREADVIILYWVAGGFISPNSLRKLSLLKKPIIWRLSDMWPFTGGCHYSGECERYVNECGQCHLLNSSRSLDISRKRFLTKQRLWNDLAISIVCPSNWIADCVRRSAIFSKGHPIVIRTGVDKQIYKPVNKLTARKVLNIPHDHKVVLLGAVNLKGDPRKGGVEAAAAIKKLTEKCNNDRILLATFGFANPTLEGLGLPVQNFGVLHDDVTLALLYSAADVFVAPSKEENLANTVIESLSCGTRVISFDIGGMPDMIKHRENGYLAEPFCTNDMAEGIVWALDQPQSQISLLGEEYSLEYQARSYIDLCHKLMSTR